MLFRCLLCYLPRKPAIASDKANAYICRKTCCAINQSQEHKSAFIAAASVCQYEYINLVLLLRKKKHMAI